MKSNTLLFLTTLCVVLAGCGSLSVSQFDGPSSDALEVQAYRTIYQGLFDQDKRVRSIAVEVVTATHYSRFMPRVRQLLRDPAIPVRFQALVAVGDLRYAPAAKDVKQIYEEQKEDMNVRMAAAYALTCLEPGQYLDLCYQQIDNKDTTIRANAALLLGKSGNRNAVKLLYWAMSDKDSDDKVQSQALESIALLKDNAIYQKIWTRLISAFIDDRITGAKAMGALGTQQAAEALMTLLDDEAPEVRLAAAEQLGRLGDPSGEAQVQKVLEKPVSGDPGQDIRIKVLGAMAIGEIGTENLARFLPQLLNDPSTVVRLSTAKAVFRRRQ